MNIRLKQFQKTLKEGKGNYTKYNSTITNKFQLVKQKLEILIIEFLAAKNNSSSFLYFFILYPKI